MSPRRRQHRLRWAPGWVALLLALAAPGVAYAEEAPKPIVMLLLDSSTSMEYSTEATYEGELPVCHDSRVDGFNYVKSRWAVAAEVLTGTFNDYWCSYDDRLDDPSREDYGHPVAHIEPKGVESGGSTQQADGLLDVYRDSIKFGMMTYDPKPGTAQDQTGGFSYGSNETWGGITTNLGARNESAPWGKLVAPPLDDDLTEMRETADLIQEQILETKPYAGSPLAPQLDDAIYFFGNHDNVKPFNDTSGEGDPYYACRSKSIIVITDGQPNLGEGTNGYPFSHAAAADLLAEGIVTYVVGYNLPPGDFPVLNEIAEAGGSGEAYIAASQADLVAALGAILVEVQGTTPSRVNTVTTTRTMNVDDRQYSFATSFAGTTVSPLDQVGFIDQYVYRCDSTCDVENGDGDAALCEIFSISDRLAERTEPRVIKTQLDGELVEFTVDNPDVTADLLGIPTTGQLPQLEPHVLPNGTKLFSGVTLGPASNPVVRAAYREQLMELVRADPGSRREGIPLGAIYHSQPVLQANLFNLAAPLPSFLVYREKEEVRIRPTPLFVGTHDGQMHAFRVDRLATLNDNDYGTEMWSFIPKHLLGELDALASGVVYLMDGEPVIAEVRMHKESLDVSVEDEADVWRSVLISGYGQGGRGYFALNVTDPENPQFMWELSNTERCFNIPEASSGCDASADFARLGLTYSKPAIGTLFFEVDPLDVDERAVAIFGGGEAVSGDAESGKSVYVVDLETGELLQEFCNTCGNVADTNAVAGNKDFIDCPMAGAVVAYDTFPGSTITRAFIGDTCGQLWRLNLASQDRENWKLEFFHDGFNVPLKHKKRRPITLAPTVATGFSPGRLVVVYGTGSGEEPLQPAERDMVFSLSEYWNGDDFVAKVNWELTLEHGETFTTDPLIFNRVAHFTTQVSSNGYCSTGAGRLWGLDFDGESDEAVNDLVPAMDADGDPLTMGDISEYIEFENTELVGIEVVQRASCVEDVSDYQPWLDGVTDSAPPPPFASPYPSGAGGGASSYFGGSGGGNLELVVQTGSTGQSSPDTEAPAGGGTSQTGNKTVQTLQQPSKTIFSTSWGLVFD